MGRWPCADITWADGLVGRPVSGGKPTSGVVCILPRRKLWNGGTVGKRVVGVTTLVWEMG